MVRLVLITLLVAALMASMFAYSVKPNSDKEVVFRKHRPPWFPPFHRNESGVQEMNNGDLILAGQPAPFFPGQNPFNN
ncbi:hypothetical protein BLOT_002802 [Blomia tropicalis]|nr:hypothetical protein BLOT_002802 [Blomia tropicalis]